MKFLFHSVATLLVACLLASTSRAADPITTQFPDTTLGAVHIDLTKIDARGLSVIVPEEARPPIQQQVQGVVEQLTSSGVTDLYISIGLPLFPPQPILVTNAGVTNEAAAKPLLAMPFQNLYGRELKGEMIDGRLFLGSQQALESFRNPDATVDLSEAFDSKLDHAIVLQWKPQTAATLSQMWPKDLPLGEGVSISPSQLAKAVSGLKLEFSLPPNESAQLTLEQVADVDPASIRKQLEPVMQLVRGQTGLQIMSPREDAKLVWELKTGQTEILAQFLGGMRQSARRSQTMNDVKQVLLAMHNHYDVYGQFPTDMKPDGTAILSWRVKALPFLDQAALYNSFDLTKPWNDSANQAQTKTVVPTYSKLPDAMTRVRFPLCKGSMWDFDGKVTFDKIIDGTSNTIAVIIAPTGAAVPWSQPGYMELDETNLMGSVFGDEDQFIAGFADGSVQVFTRAEMTEDRLRAMLTMAGREIVKR